MTNVERSQEMVGPFGPGALRLLEERPQPAPRLPGVARPSETALEAMEALVLPGMPSPVVPPVYLAPKTAGRRTGARLTDRDAVVLRHVALARVMRLDDVQCLLPRTDGGEGVLSWRTLRDVADRWRVMGMCSLEKNPWGGNGLIVAQPGIRAIPGLPETLQIGLPPIGQLRHYLEVAAVATRVISGGWGWIWEAEIRPDLDGHRPDGLLRRPGRDAVIPIEVELSLKERKRWLRIVRECVDTWGRVEYYCDPEIARKLTAWADRDLADIRSAITIHNLEAI